LALSYIQLLRFNLILQFNYVTKELFV